MTGGIRLNSLRRRIPWRLRMALWLTLLAVAVAAAVLVLTRWEGGGGESRHLFIHQFETRDYHSLAFSPADDGTVFFGHHDGLQVSADGGGAWTTVVDEPNWDAMNLVYDPFTSDTLYATGHYVFYQSEDGGQTWAEVRPNLPGLDMHAFAASPVEQGRFYAFVVGRGIYVSEGGLAQWELLSPDAPQATFSLLALADGTLLLAALDAGILRSDDGGVTWVDSGQGIGSATAFTVAGAGDGERLYAGTSEGLFVSTDGARSWTPTSLDDTQAVVVGVNPSDPLEVLVVNARGELFRSRDGGSSW